MLIVVTSIWAKKLIQSFTKSFAKSFICLLPREDSPSEKLADVVGKFWKFPGLRLIPKQNCDSDKL